MVEHVYMKSSDRFLTAIILWSFKPKYVSSTLTFLTNASVAQVVERMPEEHSVGSASLSQGTNIIKDP